MHCREWLALVESHHEEIKAAGLGVLAIGQGKVRHAVRYCGRLAPNIACICNEGDELYLEYGLREAGWGDLITKAVPNLKAGLRAASRGHTQGATTGNIQMIPGTFIVDREGVIQVAHYNDYAGDHPNIPDLLDRYREKAG